MKPKICIVISTYNSGITNKLLFSAKNELKRYGVTKAKNYKVPGAFEIPVAIARLAKKYDAFIAIGCIIKGQTANFNLISSAITNAIIHLCITNKKPIGNSIITLFNRNQASKRYNKGKEAANAVMEVLKIK